MTYHWVCN